MNKLTHLNNLLEMNIYDEVAHLMDSMDANQVDYIIREFDYTGPRLNSKECTDHSMKWLQTLDDKELVLLKGVLITRKKMESSPSVSAPQAGKRYNIDKRGEFQCTGIKNGLVSLQKIVKGKVSWQTDDYLAVTPETFKQVATPISN